MSNPFTNSLDEFCGRRVRAVSNAGREFEGFVERLHHHDRHVVLRGAADADGNHVGRVLVSHVDVLETTRPTGRVERIALDGIDPAPYQAREFDATEDRGFIARVRNDGWAGSFPTVRPAAADGDLEQPGDAGFEIVAGHKRLWVAAEAGLDSHPVQIVDIDAWTAATRFVADHLPAESDLRGNGESQDGYYARGEIEAAVDALVERWGERALDLDRVAFNVARLDLQDAVDDSREADDKLASSAAPGATSAARPSEDETNQKVSCDVEGCDYSGSERGLSIYHARTHDDDGGEPLGPEQIKALREAHGWTQSDLADQLGCGNSTVANWETAHSVPGDGYAAQLWALQEETFDSTDERDGKRGRPDTDAQPDADVEQDVAEEVDYSCPDCGAAFDSERGLSIHRGHNHKHGNGDPEEASDGERCGLEDPPDASALGTSELTPAVRALDEDRDGSGHPDGIDEADTGGEDVLERDYDQDLVVEDLNQVSEVRGRSLRQQVRAADGDVSDEQLAVQIGATTEVVQVLRSEVEAIEDRRGRTAENGSASTPASTPESSPSSRGTLRCQNCGAHVSQSYADVFTPDDVEAPRVCPSCPDKIRERDGSVRDARSTKSNARRVDQ
jgi:ParB family chromosome partitioning protein